MTQLESVARKCKELGGNPIIYHLDVSDQEKSKTAVEEFIVKTGGIDIVIANAGIGGEDNIISGDASAINEILKINILGVTNIVVPFIPAMEKHKCGKIGIINFHCQGNINFPFPACMASAIFIAALSESIRNAILNSCLAVISVAIQPGKIVVMVISFFERLWSQLSAK